MNKKKLLYCFSFVFFVLVTYAIFFFFNIDDNNKWSTFFSFTSAFGIFSTIGVYFWQKEDVKKSQRIKDNIVEEEIIRISEHYLKMINNIKSFMGDVSRIDGGYEIHSNIKENSSLFLSITGIDGYDGSHLYSDLSLAFNERGKLNNFLLNELLISKRTSEILNKVITIFCEIDLFIKYNFENKLLDNEISDIIKIHTIKRVRSHEEMDHLENIFNKLNNIVINLKK